MSKKIRILALTLALIMLVGVTPISLFATEEASSESAMTEIQGEEKESVLDFLASKATGSLYTQMAFADLLTKINSDAAIVTEGAYSGTEGNQVSFVQNATGATTQQLDSPGPNNEKDTFLWKNGEAQLLDSSVAEGTSNAKTDVTFVYSSPAQTSKGYAKNGRTLYVGSVSLKCGEANNSYISRIRIYSKQTVETCVNGVVTTQTSGDLLSSAKTLFGYDASTGALKANGITVGIYSQDEFTNLTAAYDHALDTVYLYVNGVYITSVPKILTSTSGTNKNFLVASTNHYDTVTTWTGGEDTEDTSDDNYTKISYAMTKVQTDAHFGTAGVFAGRLFSMDTARVYYTSPAAAFEEASDPRTYIDANKDPANGVFKNEETGYYYYYENGVIQGGKTVTVGPYNLVLAPHTGRITNVYYSSDVYTSISASDVTALTGTLATKTDIAMTGLNNNKNATGYVFSTDENGDYIPVIENGEGVYAAASGGKLYDVTYADGAYAFTLADGAKVAATIDATTAYAPLMVDGAAVTMEDGTAVLVKVQAESESIVATNVVTKVGNTNIYEFTKKNRKSTYYYYSSTTNLSLGTKSNIGGDMQIASGAFGTTAQNAAYVLSFDLKAGDGLDGQPLDSITFGKLRFKTSGGSNLDDNHIVTLIKNADDGKYHLNIQGADIGVFSKDAYTNVMIVLTPDFDSNGDGTADTYSIEAYSNGVKVVEKQQYLRHYYDKNKGPVSLSQNTYLAAVGVYFNNGSYMWNDPLMYMGNYQAYAYEGTTTPELVAGSVVDADLSYTGYLPLENGAYGEYVNNKLVADGIYVPAANLNGYNVALGEKIGLNFYVTPTSVNNVENAKAVFTVGDETQTVYLGDAEITESGYKLSALLSSIQMDTPVTLEIYDGEGNKTIITKDAKIYDSFNYTVKEYAEYLVKNSATYGTAAVNAAKAMVLYGAFAERYLAGSSDLATAGAATTNFERASVQFSEVGSIATIAGVSSNTLSVTNTDYDGVDLTATASDVTMLGEVKLVLDSALKIRISLNVTEAPTVDGGRIHTETDENGVVSYYVDIEGLTAVDYNTVKTVYVNNNKINVTVLAAANVVVSDTTGAYSTEFKNLMRALYGYYYYTAVYAKLI
ncbi:MAG: hypothetical protein IKB38_00335 [Clostridia bacterium]|nr:hypothetical protein [Clostridia bacterium]